MDCLTAQQLVSAALDSEPVDAAALETAKTHCRECPECASFVRALVQVKKSTPPEPDPALVDRIVVAVRAEHARARKAVAEPVPAADIAASVTMDPGKAVPGRGLVPQLLDPRNRTSLIAWSATAAVVFIAAGIGTVVGVRTMFTDRPQNEVVVLDAAQFDAALSESTMAAPQSAAPAPESAKTASTSNGGLITVDGVVYRATGTDASVTEEGLSRQGSTTTSLDTGDSPTSRDVLGTGDPARVFLVGEDDAMLGFDRVTTTFQGITYTLTSGPIASYADPLTLPEGIPQPTDSDGSPVFTPVDEVQPPVYVREGSDPSQGIALPPGRRTDISAEWTWWVPARD